MCMCSLYMALLLDVLYHVKWIHYVKCAITVLILIRTQYKIKKSDKHLKEIMKVLEVCSTVTVHVALL